jgi:hypothetical protein
VAAPPPVFHVQLRQFPNVARAFNLTGEELSADLLSQWVAGRPVELHDRRWDPQRARLTIYEGPELRPDEIGLGRGWGNVTRSGTDVTARMLVQARDGLGTGDTLKAAIMAGCAAQPLTLGEVVALVGVEGMRASERLARAEQAVWELLHTGTARLVRGGASVSQAEWGTELLSWKAWRDDVLVIEAVPPG